MNNKEFIASLAQEQGYTAGSTQRLVNNMVDAISQILQEGEPVAILNFGVFEIKKRLERIVVNPTTKQKMLVPPKLIVIFKPSQAWKDDIRKSESKK